MISKKVCFLITLPHTYAIKKTITLGSYLMLQPHLSVPGSSQHICETPSSPSPLDLSSGLATRSHRLPERSRGAMLLRFPVTSTHPRWQANIFIIFWPCNCGFFVTVVFYAHFTRLDGETDKTSVSLMARWFLSICNDMHFIAFDTRGIICKFTDLQTPATHISGNEA